MEGMGTSGARGGEGPCPRGLTGCVPDFPLQLHGAGDSYNIMSYLLGFSMPGGPELFFILLIVLVLFGAKRLPELARGLGSSVREFRKAKDEFDDELNKTRDDLTIQEAKDKQVRKVG